MILVMAKGTHTTIDHNEVREWTEERDGTPSVLRGEGGIADLLRIDFGDGEENLMEISWKEFFRVFEENSLAFVYQEETPEGDVSRFCKFVSRDGDDEVAGFSDDEDEDEDEEDDMVEEDQ